jgi:hypothetical protein
MLALTGNIQPRHRCGNRKDYAAQSGRAMHGPPAVIPPLAVVPAKAGTHDPHGGANGFLLAQE